ncbi:DUF4232 domain-containing protein [Streptomyces bobili]|uniref:DUF4232 domain-containing protein n=1 Tax=Streptomyces bobili TaxID=67280 RepID=UPI0034335B91
MRIALRKNTVLALAAAAALSLSLTACNGDSTKDGATGTKTTGTSSNTASGSTGAAAGDSADANAATTTDQKASGAGGSTGSSGSGASDGSADTTALCKANDLDFAFLERQQGTESAHLLITATTTGAACVLKGIPIVTPGEMNGTVPHSSDDTAAQRVVLSSGKKAYSAIVLDPTKQGGDSWDLVRIAMDTGDTEPDSGNLVTQKLKNSVTSGPDLAVTNWNTAKPFDF